MFIIVPVGTDAPLYHLPYSTGGLILLNVVVFAVQLFCPGFTETFILQYGTINPIQWFTSICMHGGIGHLVGNMIILVLTGMIVEGKVGWWRFLLIYFGIGVGASAFEQLITLSFSSGGALGASGVIFGLIAICMVWAPENEVTLLCAGTFFFRVFATTFTTSVMNVAFFMIAMEFLTLAFTGFQISSAALHMMGAIPGFFVAFGMLKLRRVDCDGYDLVSTWTGKRGQRTLTVEAEKAENERQIEARLDAQRTRETGLMMVDKYIQAGHYDQAVSRFQMLRGNDHSLVMSQTQYQQIINAYDSDESTKLKAIPLLESYLENYSEHKIRYTLMLARAHIVLQSRPRQALKVLKTLQWNELNPKQQEFVRKLIARAKQMIADGTLEVWE